MDFLYLWLKRIQANHETVELLFRQVGGFFPGARPGHAAVLETFVQQKESRAHPQQSFHPVAAPPAEKKKGSFFFFFLDISF